MEQSGAQVSLIAVFLVSLLQEMNLSFLEVRKLYFRKVRFCVSLLCTLADGTVCCTILSGGSPDAECLPWSLALSWECGQFFSDSC